MISKLTNQFLWMKYIFTFPVLIGISVITYFCWYFQLDSIALIIYSIVFMFILVLNKDVMYAVPILFNALFLISQQDWNMDLIPIGLYVGPAVIVFSMILHVILYRVKLFQGKLSIGLLVMIIAMILSSFNSVVFNQYYLFYIFVGIFYALIYFFFRNAMQGDHLEDIIKLFFILGILVSVQVFTYYLRVEDIIHALEFKTIDLGWGISNFIATYLILFIPTTFYYAKNKERNILYIFISIFQTIMLIFTLSRGGIVAYAAVLFLMVIYLMKDLHWKKTLLNALLGILIVVVIYFINVDLFQTILDRLMNQMLDDSGRFTLYAEAWQHFLEHPFFGSGLFARMGDSLELRMFHNTFLHTIATMGLVGLAALLIQMVQMIKVLIHRIEPKTIVIMFSLTGAFIHGLVDNVYYMPQFMILIFVIIAVLENRNLGFEPQLKKVSL